MRKTSYILIVVILVMASFFLGYAINNSGDSNSEIQTLQEQVNNLQLEKNGLQTSIDNLNIQRNNLQKQLEEDSEIEDLEIKKEDIQLIFESSECDNSIDPYEDSNLGVKNITWIDSDSLEVVAYIKINCANSVTSGDFDINQSSITLKYENTECTECTSCECAHKLTYRFDNITKKDYKITI